MANPHSEIRIAVMGATGSGKSTFINIASGSNLLVGHGLQSCTSDVQTSLSFVVSARVVTLIDTPGFDDTTLTDTDILAMIAAYLSKTYEHGARLAGLIYMHRISDVRMGGTSKRNFNIFRKLCGESSLRNVLIVSNMWSMVTPEIGEAREAELNKFFKPVLDKRARLLRHDGTLQSAHAILRHLIDSAPGTLRIQQEIVNEHKPIEHTAAGSELRRTLDLQAERHKEEIRKLRAEAEAAVQAKNELARDELEEELERKQQEFMRIEKTSRRMAAEFAAERARLEARIQHMEHEHEKQLRMLTSLQGEVARFRHLELDQQREEELVRMRREMEEVHATQERETALAEAVFAEQEEDAELQDEILCEAVPAENREDAVMAQRKIALSARACANHAVKRSRWWRLFELAFFISFFRYWWNFRST